MRACSILQKSSYKYAYQRHACFEILIPLSRYPPSWLNAVTDVSYSEVPFVLDDSSVLDYRGIFDHPLWFDIPLQARIVVTRSDRCGEHASTFVARAKKFSDGSWGQDVCTVVVCEQLDVVLLRVQDERLGDNAAIFYID